MNEQEYEIGYALARAAVERIADGNRDLVWGSMLYACNGRKKGDGFDLPPCGHSERYYLGVGVEGPPDLRNATNAHVQELRASIDDETDDVAAILALLDEGYVPCAFGAGRCPECYGGEMLHSRFDLDEDFGELREPPPGARYFRVPDPARAAYSARFEGFGAGELVAAPEVAL